MYEGEGVPQDRAEAFKYHKMAAEQGRGDAQYNCGYMLYNGKGVSQDLPEAFEYYKKTLEVDNA